MGYKYAQNSFYEIIDLLRKTYNNNTVYLSSLVG